jgi:replicative DNA helicase
MNAPFHPEVANRLMAAEAEQFVIGALLRNNDAVDRIGDLRTEHFAIAENRAIFAQMVWMIGKGEAADVLTVSDALKAKGSESGDLFYLNALLNNSASTANIGRYALMIREAAIKRGLVELGHEAVAAAEESAFDSAVLVDQISSKLEKLAQARVKQEPVRAADELYQHIELLENRRTGSAPKGISTGFPDVDAKLNGGPRRGQLIVLAARPKMGKTAFALNIACNMARDYAVLVQSMEMPKSELHDRNLASQGKIPLPHVIDTALMNNSEWDNLTAAVVKINDMKLYLDDQGGCTLMDIRMKAKQVKRRAGLDVLVIDYLQLMNGEGDNRNAQIESITRGLKALAKELDIAVILLSQLNRELERRPNKRPIPSDLRDSGSIEQDADVVIFLYRDEVYNPDSMDKGICEVDIALNRQGSNGRVALTYFGEQTRFESLTRSWQPAPPKTNPSRPRGFID